MVSIKYREEECKAFSGYRRSFFKYFLAGSLFGLGTLIYGPITSNTFYALRKDEFAVVSEYDLREILPYGSGDIRNIADIPMIYFLDKPISAFGPHPGGKMTIVTFDDKPLIDLSAFGIKLYAHYPFPFGKHEVLKISDTFEIKVPLIFALDQYTFLVFTKDGPQKVYHIPGVVSDIKPNMHNSYWNEQIEPIKIIWLKIKFNYDVKDKELYAILLKNANWNKNLQVEKFIHDNISLSYSSVTGAPNLKTGMLQYMFTTLIENHPLYKQFLETNNPDVLYQIITDVQATFLSDTKDVFDEFEFQKILDSFEGKYGIDIKSFETELFEDSISKSF
jgi:hypothetical protein